METITHKELGSRLSKLRKLKGFSQENLAKILDIPRPSLTQIELGKRNISVIELKKITDNLSVSIDKFLSQEFIIEDINFPTSESDDNENIRISTAKLNANKFKEILLYILEKCAGKPNIGETTLFKLLYFADFNYYELYEEHLTGAEYRKLPLGPVPQKFNAVIQQMLENKMIKRFKTDYNGHQQIRYFPLIKPNLKNLKASEVAIIDKVIDQFSDWSASAIDDFSLNDMPWLATKNGEAIDYELAFYREHPYSARTYNEEFNER
jgi:transcriptional regulator with XRE-family HTH domain